MLTISPPGQYFNLSVPIYVPTSEKELLLHLQNKPLMTADSFKFGFDTEFHENKLEYIQIASIHQILIIPVYMISKLPDSLKDLLQLPHWIKAGFACATDVKMIEQKYDIKMNGVIDTQLLYRFKFAKSYQDPDVDLYHACGLNVKQPRTGRWDVKVMDLSRAQIEYAAYDAWLSMYALAHLTCVPTSLSTTNRVLNVLSSIPLEKMPCHKGLPSYIASAILRTPVTPESTERASRIVEELISAGRLELVRSGSKWKYVVKYV